MSDSRTFTATCHCRTSTLSFTVPTSSLPLAVHFCHCSICRHTHGTLCTMHAQIPRPMGDFAALTEYRSSERVRRWFCAGCGAHVVDCCVEREGEKEGESWYVATALVDAEEDVWRFGSSIFVDGTGDGGLAAVMGDVQGMRMEVWEGREGGEAWSPGLARSAGSQKNDASAVERKKSTEDKHTGTRVVRKDDKELHLRCHCTAIHLSIARPPSPSIFSSIDPTVIPNDKSKWFALHDACDSCRLTSSSAIVSWLFPLRSCVTVHTPDGRIPYPDDGLFSTVKKYTSSPGVTRTFCGTCGATVSYACEERREMVDLAAGLVVVEGEGGDLKGVKGVTAEEWIEWGGRVAFEGDARWKGVIKGLKEGLAKRGGGEV